MRKGTSLVELVVCLMIVSILTAVAVPSAKRILAGVAAERAARDLMAAHRIARFTAIMRARPTQLEVTPESLVVRVLAGPESGVVWRAAGPASDGVALAAPTYPLAFTPLGLPKGVGNATYTFTRGSASRSVVISRLGRLRLERQ